MLLFFCSLPADSMSRSSSFCPSTMATRSSSACVALKSMRFIVLFSRARGQHSLNVLDWHHRVRCHGYADGLSGLVAKRATDRNVCRCFWRAYQVLSPVHEWTNLCWLRVIECESGRRPKCV